MRRLPQGLHPAQARACKIASMPYDARDGQGGLRRYGLSAKTHVLRVNQPGATGLCSVKDVCKRVFSRSPAHFSLELVRYTCVGGLASLVDVGLLWVLTSFVGVYYLHAATIAFGFGLITSYLLSIAWVFHERKFHNPLVELGLFTLIGGVGLLCNGMAIWFFTEYADLHYLCSKMVAGLFVFLWNFLAKKLVLFHR
jgi:putative flippase GtrA